eukprot:359953-Chlamydomonas_euryale.AAC.8
MPEELRRGGGKGGRSCRIPAALGAGKGEELASSVARAREARGEGTTGGGRDQRKGNVGGVDSRGWRGGRRDEG